jgi:hypothetical protein
LLKAFLTPQKEHTRTELLEAYMMVWHGVKMKHPTLSENSLPESLRRKIPAMARRDLGCALKWNEKLRIKLELSTTKGEKKRQATIRSEKELQNRVDLVLSTHSGILNSARHTLAPGLLHYFHMHIAITVAFSFVQVSFSRARSRRISCRSCWASGR